MKYFNKRFFLIALTATVAFAGCKKSFLDVNDDPNRVTEQNITPELIFPQAAHAAGARNASRDFQFIDNWLGYWSASGSFAIQQDETSYNIDFSFGNTLWINQYNVLFDLYQAKTKSLAKGDSVLASASMILSVKLWQDLVDIFGDVPYSQAFKNSQYTQPAFDKAQNIYADLLKTLDTAVNYMKLTPRSTFESVDIVNGGDQTKWIKLANTLRLRLLIRQSEVPGFNPTAELAKITANGGVLHSGETVSVNPGYTNSQDKQSPFYANYGLTPTGTEASTITRANAYFVNLLTSTNDPRVAAEFLPVGTSYVGTTYGLAAGNPDGAHSSRIGPGLARSADQDQWIMTSVESMFLEAEAIARGWLSGSTTQAAYEAAVTESFLFLGLTAADANNYLHNTPAADAIANFANAGSSTASKVKFIVYQKYIAMAGIDPLEAWSDQRRLHFLPDNGYISVNPSRISNTLPLRLPYPQSEYTTNAANVGAVGTVNIFTTKIFWEP